MDRNSEEYKQYMRDYMRERYNRLRAETVEIIGRETLDNALLA